MKKGLFLDLDGTLCDSMDLLKRVWTRFLADHGHSPPIEEFDLVNGPPLPEVLRRMKDRYLLPGTVEALTSAYAARIHETHEFAAPASGAGALLERARARGWIVAVVTSNSRAATAAWLARTGFEGLVETMVCGEDVAKGKPDPEPYRTAVARTGCEAAASFAVEDSAEGAMAAAGAGLPIWVLTDWAGKAVETSPLYRGRLDGLAALIDSL